MLDLTNYLIKEKTWKRSSVSNPRKPQVNESVPMGTWQPGIHWPGKAVGCQHSEGSWDRLLTQLPGGSAEVVLTWTWS